MKLEKTFVFILIIFMFALPFSYANAKDLQKILNGKIVPLKISFPEITQIPKTVEIKTDFLSAIDYTPLLTVANFSNFHMGKSFDLRMKEQKKIKIEVDTPFSKLFDITWDVYDLNGYISAKQKAHEICEQHTIRMLASK